MEEVQRKAAETAPPTPAPLQLATRGAVHLVDVEERHIRRPGDLVSAILFAVAIVMVLLLAVYGQSTVAGVTEDVSEVVNDALGQLLLFPVNALEGLVILLIPVSVIVSSILRRNWRILVEAVIGAVAAAVIAWLAVQGLGLLELTHPLNVGLTRNPRGLAVPAFSPFIAAISALLTVVGRGPNSKLVRWSWYFLLFVIAMAVIQGDQTSAGAVITVLLGRVVGFSARYIGGARSTRASGLHLVRGLRRAGLDPDRVVRLDVAEGPLRAWLVASAAPVGHNAQLRVTTDPLPLAPTHHQGTPHRRPAAEPGLDAVSEAIRALDVAGEVIVPDPLPIPPDVVALLGRDRRGGPLAYRTYAVWQNGVRSDVTVLDGDRHVVGFLAGLWETIRLRGVERRVAPTLRETAEHAVLMNYVAAAAGVNVPPIAGIAAAADSILMVQPHVEGLRPLASVAPVPEDLIDALWRQVAAAHDRGIAHRNLALSNIQVGPDDTVWIRGWESGEITSSELSRRFDLAQLLTLIALLVGVPRAMASARRTLTDQQLASIAPLLQGAALPHETRVAMSSRKALLRDLRGALTELIPAASAEPLQLRRFSPRTVLTTTVLLLAAVIVFGSLNLEDVLAAFAEANPWWLVAAFAAGLLTYYGSALGLTAFTQEKLGVWKTTKVQVAASIVSLVAPAGVGPAAIDLRFLSKQRVEAPVAVATVTFTAVSRFVSTVIMLVLVAIFSGSAGSVALPSASVIIVVAVIVLVVGVLVAIPRIRTLAWERLGPILRQVWPRLVWLLGNPGRLAVGFTGNVIQAAAYVVSFGFVLAAFGHSLPVSTLAITYLASNTAGSLVPSPAGIGPVELALTSGLTLAGIPSATALSVTLVFRVLTLWARVPLGWLALRSLQRSNDL